MTEDPAPPPAPRVSWPRDLSLVLQVLTWTSETLMLAEPMVANMSARKSPAHLRAVTSAGAATSNSRSALAHSAVGRSMRPAIMMAWIYLHAGARAALGLARPPVQSVIPSANAGRSDGRCAGGLPTLHRAQAASRSARGAI